ncbi:MAG: peptide chain release factor N(5)-glutamine methyltransferase [Desulfocapsaceae bacterium]|nr:peptide chain release factor N(5)-glutamine methyltransferase [Desulfocapsaceae bacterium]
MHVLDLVHFGVKQLESTGIEQAALEVELLLGFCLGKNRAGLFLAATDEVDDRQEQQFRSLLDRRAAHEPSAYILGEREFWSLPFFVTPAVLIPRPETEFLLETVLAVVRNGKWQPGPILDLCCGSGVIGIILALEMGRPVTAVDLSAPALQIARQNARRHQVADLLSLVQADLLSAFSFRPHFSLVVSNPPYVSRQELQDGLQPEVMRYEPSLALDGGICGLDIIRRIRKTLPQVLRPGGEFFMEIGADQGQAVIQLFNTTHESGEKIFERVELLQDYSGRDRVLRAKMVKHPLVQEQL